MDSIHGDDGIGAITHRQAHQVCCRQHMSVASQCHSIYPTPEGKSRRIANFVLAEFADYSLFPRDCNGVSGGGVALASCTMGEQCL